MVDWRNGRYWQVGSNVAWYIIMMPEIPWISRAKHTGRIESDQNFLAVNMI